jgi:Domain of unknown function (DUF6894)
VLGQFNLRTSHRFTSEKENAFARRFNRIVRKFITYFAARLECLSARLEYAAASHNGDCQAMARYFFHLRSGTCRVRDEEGKEFPDLAGAYNHARHIAQKIIMHVGFDDERDWRVIVSAYTRTEAELIVLFPNPLEHVAKPKTSLPASGKQ